MSWLRALGFVVAAILIGPAVASADDYPTKPIRLMIPTAAGG
jgi:tripartite-type tricarboxylate transporter receptor subunit TctC